MKPIHCALLTLILSFLMSCFFIPLNRSYNTPNNEKIKDVDGVLSPTGQLSSPDKNIDLYVNGKVFKNIIPVSTMQVEPWMLNSQMFLDKERRLNIAYVDKMGGVKHFRIKSPVEEIKEPVKTSPIKKTPVNKK